MTVICTKHTDMVIALETARLLGVPFSGYNLSHAYKFVPSERGPALHQRKVYDTHVLGPWVRLTEYPSPEEFELMMVNRVLYRVSFSDEGGAL